MEKLYELKKTLCRELDKISDKRDMTAGDLEMAHKLTDTIKNIDKIIMLEEDDGYSQAGNWHADIRGGYGDGYSGRRHRDSLWRYSRNDRDYSMMGHSYSGDNIAMLEDMRRDEKDPRKREAIDRLIREMEG